MRLGSQLQLTSSAGFGKKKQITGAQIGSAVHELMQADSADRPTLRLAFAASLTQVQADAAVKKEIDLAKIEAFSPQN